jgi:hypothetical protein
MKYKSFVFVIFLGHYFSFNCFLEFSFLVGWWDSWDGASLPYGYAGSYDGAEIVLLFFILFVFVCFFVLVAHIC